MYEVKMMEDVDANEEVILIEDHEEETKEDNNEKIKNRGTGAGGSNTNLYGNKFDKEKTLNESRLIQFGYNKIGLSKKAKHYYLLKQFEDKNVVFVSQHNFKKYMKYKYEIVLYKCPDEAYIIEYNDGRKVLKILEKKEQCTDGSVEEKLWAGPSFKRAYELRVKNIFEVQFAYCVNEFLANKIKSGTDKYDDLNIIYAESSIEVLFGDDDDYFETLDNWIDS